LDLAVPRIVTANSGVAEKPQCDLAPKILIRLAWNFAGSSAHNTCFLERCLSSRNASHVPRTSVELLAFLLFKNQGVL
jgi:hypothetical protein